MLKRLTSLLAKRSAGWSNANPVPLNSQYGMYGGWGNAARITTDTALRASMVWAALRLRADLISTMPVNVYRKVDGVAVEVPTPPVLVSPGGDRCSMQEFLYSTQIDLDRAGNCFGVITERNALGLPARIDLAPLDQVSVAYTGGLNGDIIVNIGGDRYDYADIWHERQYTVPGSLLGLSPVAYSAYSVSTYLSAQHFALDWFGNSAMPAVELKNTARTVPPAVAEAAKSQYASSVRPGGVFVTGNDWELKPIAAVNSQSQYIELMQSGGPEIARFFGVPADLIDASSSGSHITYANIGQRNLQLLIMHLGPPIARREAALSTLLPAPRYVKLNRSALLAMDAATRANTLMVRLASRQITPTEARAIEDLPPLTPEQLDEIEAVYGPPGSPTGTSTPMSPTTVKPQAEGGSM